MSDVNIDTTLRNNMLDEITAYVGASGLLRIYSGTKPAGGGAATTLLAQLTLNATFAAAASGGVLTLNSIASDTSAAASGTATWARIWRSDGTTYCMDLDVSTTAAGTGDLQLDSTTITLGGTVALGGPNTITAANAN